MRCQSVAPFRSEETTAIPDPARAKRSMALLARAVDAEAAAATLARATPVVGESELNSAVAGHQIYMADAVV
jgi:hypothetical protein